jgi:hypothetical protein
MRKILVIVLVCVCSFLNAQNWNIITNGSKYTQTTFLGGIKCDSGLILPTIANLTTQHFATSLGAICKYNDSLYFRTATGWINIMRTATSGTFDTTSLSNRIDEKQDIIATGTTSQYLRGDGSLATFPTIPSAIDTTSLSNRINLKLNISDTASMLTHYLRSVNAAATYATTSQLATKLNVSDTSSMLAAYLRSNVASSTYATISSLALKTNISDTATMLTPYLRSNTASSTYATISNLALKVAIADTATMLSKYLRKTDTTTMLSPYLTTIASNSDALYNTATFSSSNHVGTLTQNLATQTSYKLLGTGNASATPTFRTIDSNYFNNTFATQVRAAQANTGGTITSLTLGRGITGTSPITTTGTIGIDTTQTYTWTAANVFSTSIRTPQLYGSTSASGTLTLNSTSNATKGKLLFGTSAYDEVNNYLGVNKTTPACKLDVLGTSTNTEVLRVSNEGTNTHTIFNFYNANSDPSTYRNIFSANQSRGTLASPTTLASGDVQFSILASGYDGTAYQTKSSLDFITNGTVSSGVVPTDIVIKGSATSSARAETFRFTSAGRLGINTNNPTQDLHIKGKTSNNAMILLEGAATGYGGSLQMMKTSDNITGDFLGRISFLNSDANEYARIQSVQGDGTSNNHGDLRFYTATGGGGIGAGAARMTITTGGKIGIGVTSPTAYLHLLAGTSTANTAPLKFTSGTNLATAENGSVEYDGTSYYATAGGTRQYICKGISGSYSGTGSVTTDFVVTFGGTQPNATYQVLITPTNATTAAVLYVTTKTTTAFTVKFLTGLTGTVAFDWHLIQQ